MGEIWFAWYPVETDDGWVWLSFVECFVDHFGTRTNEYFGIPEIEYYYKKIKKEN